MKNSEPRSILLTVNDIGTSWPKSPSATKMYVININNSTDVGKFSFQDLGHPSSVPQCMLRHVAENFFFIFQNVFPSTSSKYKFWRLG